MANQAPPDGWQMGLVGKWDTGDGTGDAKASTGAGFFGGSALRIGSDTNTTLTSMFGPWISLDTVSFQPTYLVGFRAKNITGAGGGPSYLVQFVQYDITRVTPTATTLLNGIIGQVAYSQPIIPVGPWGRFEIKKQSAINGAADFTECTCDRQPAHGILQLAANQNVPNGLGVWHTVQFDGGVAGNLYSDLDSPNLRTNSLGFQLSRAGIYMAIGTAYYANTGNNASTFQARFATGGGVSISPIVSNQVVVPLLGNATPVVQCSAILRISDVVTNGAVAFQVSQNTGGNINLLGTTGGPANNNVSVTQFQISQLK